MKILHKISTIVEARSRNKIFIKMRNGQLN